MESPTKSEMNDNLDTVKTCGANGESELFVDPIVEKKLLRKLDLYIAPVMTLIFLTAYLDRSNIGNAASARMTKDLGMSSDQLGSRMISLLMFLWSIVIIGTGFTPTPGQMYASRLLLGLFESGMFPCLALYLGTSYAPREQALRVSYLFVSPALSGAFGGLFAYAILKMNGIAGLAGWRWLFIIEGIASVLISIAIFFVLPDDFETARFLNESDLEVMRLRADINVRYNGNPNFDWAEVRKAATDPKLYVSCWSQFWADVCSFGLSSFLPLILKSFGFDTVTTQLLTIPIYAWASGSYLLVSWLSDRMQSRYAFMLPAVILTAIGYAVNLGVPASQRGALYFSMFLIAPGIYIIVGLNHTWLLNSHAGYYKRATAVGMNQSIDNSAGLVVRQVFKKTLNRKYVIGLSFSLGAVLCAGLGHTILFFFLRSENQTREEMTEKRRKYEIQHEKRGDFHPDYRYST